MLPTPSTSHVSFDNVYEPAEDSYLLLDTLSSETEIKFLYERFSQACESSTPQYPNNTETPVILEVGTGSGVVLAFVTAYAKTILGRQDVLTLGIDINSFACRATAQTVNTAIDDAKGDVLPEKRRHGCGMFLDSVIGDLANPIQHGSIDVLIFNPPYVPTTDLPDLSKHETYNAVASKDAKTSFDQDSHLLALSYAGGVDGMEVTSKLLDQLPDVLHPGRGVAYILLCTQNKPDEVKERICKWGSGWAAEAVRHSGKTGGWEKLQILRVWRTGG